jgi:hypothetical protein
MDDHHEHPHSSRNRRTSRGSRILPHRTRHEAFTSGSNESATPISAEGHSVVTAVAAANRLFAAATPRSVDS